MTDLMTELKRRNVFRVGIAYAVASWIILQLTDVIGEILELPAWIGKIILVMLAVGLVLALFFAWAFELTPEGLKRETEVDRSQSIAPHTGRKLDRAIIALLVLALAYFVYESRFMEQEAEPPAPTQAERAMTADGSPAVTPPDPLNTGPVTSPRSIAVLPFANRSMNEEDSFFTDGIHDDLLTQLAKIADLKVISRTSVMQYKDTSMPIPQIAEELQVATILEGGVQRAGKRIRINAQLIDVRNDQHMWAETFDREMTVENIFDIQSEITRQIVQAVRGELSADERANLARVPTNDLQAYEAYLQALALVNRTDYAAENFIQAQFWAERAVTLDPEFAQAWALLVEINGQAVWIGYDSSPQRFEATRIALDNARRHGPGLPETIAAEAEYAYRIEQNFRKSAELYSQAHAALPGDVDILFRLGVAQRRTPDLAGAIDSFERAMVLDPQHSRSPNVLAEMLLVMNELDRVERLIETSTLKFPDVQDLQVDRIDLHLNRGDLGMAAALFENLAPWPGPKYVNLATDIHFPLRDYDSAISVWDQPFIADRADDRGLLGQREARRAWAHHLRGEAEAARSEARRGIQRVSEAPPQDTYNHAFELLNLAICHVFAGDPQRALEAVERGRRLLPEERDFLWGSLYSMARAQVLALTGEREQALAEIERLLHTPYRFNKWRLYQDPRWDFFRDDERFNELIRPEGASS